MHPYAVMYADFEDFHLWRIRPMGALFVGGFARAIRLRQADLVPDPASVAAVAAAEAGIIAHCNKDHPDALGAIARDSGDWRMVTADADGADLAAEKRVMRIHWSAPAMDVGDPHGTRANDTEGTGRKYPLNVCVVNKHKDDYHEGRMHTKIKRKFIKSSFSCASCLRVNITLSYQTGSVADRPRCNLCRPQRNQSRAAGASQRQFRCSYTHEFRITRPGRAPVCLPSSEQT